MAEHAAHLTATLQPKPSIFEVVAADSLQASFYPAIKRVCTSLAHSKPETLGWLVRYYDEFYVLINGIIESHYIREYGGSLAEVFYGLTRSSHQTDCTSRRSKSIIFISIVILPYLRRKVDRLIQNWKSETDDCQFDRNAKVKLKLISTYNILLAIWQCLHVYQYITYMANVSKSHSLPLRFVRMSLEFLPPESQANDDYSWSDVFAGKIRYSTVLTAFIFRGLELSAFFLQFVQWWQHETNHGNITSLPIPHAPALDANSNKYAGKCPLCLQVWQIPTVVSISGYVYCYTCIVRHFDGVSKTCPVTNYPASIDDLLRIYDDC